MKNFISWSRHKTAKLTSLWSGEKGAKLTDTTQLQTLIPFSKLCGTFQASSICKAI